jgi:hypothetical protein
VHSEVLRLRFDDSRDLVLEGLTPEEVPSPTDDEPRFEDLIRGALMGAAEQLATVTAGTFSLGPGPRELKDLSPQTSENTRSILLLCFTRALYALYSFMVYSPIMTFTLFSISTMKASALTKLNPKFRERHLLSCPIDLEVYDLSGRPSTRNRPNPRSHEFFDNVAATNYSASKMKGTFAVPDPQRPLIEFGCVHRFQGRNQARQGMSRAGVAGNF